LTIFFGILALKDHGTEAAHNNCFNLTSAG
jgi:hypothetical protein